MEAAAVLIVLADAQDAQLVLTVTGVLMDAEVAVKVDAQVVEAVVTVYWMWFMHLKRHAVMK